MSFGMLREKLLGEGELQVRVEEVAGFAPLGGGGGLGCDRVRASARTVLLRSLSDAGELINAPWSARVLVGFLGKFLEDRRFTDV